MRCEVNGLRPVYFSYLQVQHCASHLQPWNYSKWN